MEWSVRVYTAGDGWREKTLPYIMMISSSCEWYDDELTKHDDDGMTVKFDLIEVHVYFDSPQVPLAGIF